MPTPFDEPFIPENFFRQVASFNLRPTGIEGTGQQLFDGWGPEETSVRS